MTATAPQLEQEQLDRIHWACRLAIEWANGDIWRAYYELMNNGGCNVEAIERDYLTNYPELEDLSNAQVYGEVHAWFTKNHPNEELPIYNLWGFPLNSRGNK